MNKKINGELPLGLGMALMENPPANARFAALPPEKQQIIISRIHSISSKSEMRQFVEHIGISD